MNVLTGLVTAGMVITSAICAVRIVGILITIKLERDRKTWYENKRYREEDNGRS